MSTHENEKTELVESGVTEGSEETNIGLSP